MFNCVKKELKDVYSIVKKIVGKYRDVYLLTRGYSLYLIVNTNIYLKVMIPAEVTENNKTIQMDVSTFESLLSFRGENIKVILDSERNNISVISGTKAELHINTKVSKEDYELPPFKTSEVIDLDVKTVSKFRDYVSPVIFVSPDDGEHDFSQIISSDKFFAIHNASDNIMTTVKFRPLKGSNFIISVSNKIKEVLKLAPEKLQLRLSDNSMMLDSETITCTLPSIQDDSFLGCIEASKTLLSGASFIEGSATFNYKDFNDILHSVRSISMGRDIISLRFKEDKVVISQSSNLGKTADTVKGNISFKEKVNIELPELFLVDAFAMMTSVLGKDCEFEFQFPDTLNFFLIKAKGKNCVFTCVGPSV